MKKLLFVSLFVLMVSIPFARTTSMLLPFWAIEDEESVLVLPSTLLLYPDQFILSDMNDSNGVTAGIHAKLSDNMTFGLYLNSPYKNYLPRIWNYPWDYNTWEIGDFAPDFTAFIRNYFHFVFGLDLDKIKIGFLFNLAGFNDSITEKEYEVGDPVNGDWEWENTQQSSEMNFVLDIRLEDFAMFNAFNFAVNFGLPSMNYNDTSKEFDGIDWALEEYTTKLKGAMYFGLKILAELEKMRLFLGFQMNNIGHNNAYIEDNESDGTIDYYEYHNVMHSFTIFTFGIAKTIKLEKIHLYTGGWFGYTLQKWNGKDYDNSEILDEETDYKTSEMVLPVFLSAEFFINKWFTLRSGFRFDILNYFADVLTLPELDVDGEVTATNRFEETEFSPYYASIYIGAGFTFNRISIDITVDPWTLANTYIMSGVGTGTPVVSVTGTYYWR